MEILQYYFEPHESSMLDKTWDVAFIGIAIDDRGDFSIKSLNEKAGRVISISYNPETFQVNIDGKVSLFEQEKFSLDNTSNTVVIDLTTLGFIEVLYLMKMLKRSLIHFDALYFEPKSYKKFKSDIPIVQKQYDLSNIVNDFSSLPGFTVVDELYNQKEYLFLTGYEANRIEAAFEYKEEITGQNSHVIFGVPAYNAGWETNALFNNIEVIDVERISGSINYSGATDVKFTFEQIKKIVDALPNENSNLCILPLSNKPMALAAALSLLSFKESTNLLYDHPTNLPSRTEQVGRCHLYCVSWDS